MNEFHPTPSIGPIVPDFTSDVPMAARVEEADAPVPFAGGAADGAAALYPIASIPEPMHPISSLMSDAGAGGFAMEAADGDAPAE